MTDIDGSGQVPRRSGRAGDGGAPVSGALAIVLAVVAVVAGFLILNSLSGDGNDQADFPVPGNTSDDDAPPSDDSGSTDANGSEVPALPTTTTAPPLQVAGASVIVANANGQGGSAGRVTTVRETGAGFTTVQATNSHAKVGDLDDSVIYYDATVPAAQTVADSVNRVLGGGLLVQPKPEVAPISDGDLRGAGVLLMLGKDHADITVDQLVLADSAAVTPAITNPPTGGTTPTTEADG